MESFPAIANVANAMDANAVPVPVAVNIYFGRGAVSKSAATRQMHALVLENKKRYNNASNKRLFAEGLLRQLSVGKIVTFIHIKKGGRPHQLDQNNKEDFREIVTKFMAVFQNYQSNGAKQQAQGRVATTTQFAPNDRYHHWKGQVGR